MSKIRLKVNYISLILINVVLMGLPLIAALLTEKQLDIYEFRTLLTEKAYLFILAMACIAVISFFKVSSRPFGLLTRIILTLLAIIGIFFYLSLYDYLLTY